MASEKQPISGRVAPAEAGREAARGLDRVHAAAVGPQHQAPRRGIFGAIKTLLAVIPLTILIWAYAERESLDKPQDGVPVRIRLHSSSPDYLVRIVAPSTDVITVKIEGSRAKVEHVRSLLTSGGNEGVVDIAVPPNLPDGKTTPLSLQRQVEDAPIFKENAIAVTSCQPASMDVRVDQLVSRTVRPGLQQGVASRISGKIEFDPPVVTLRGPQSALRNPESLGVYADPPENDIPKSPMEHVIPDVPVRLGRSDDTITITPSTVKISIRVKESNVSYQIPSVPVFVRMPSTMQDRYRVQFKISASMSNITVEGPEDEIALLRSETFKPEATLNIMPQDASGQLPRAPSYTLPPHVTVSDKDKTRTIDFSLQDRNAPE